VTFPGNVWSGSASIVTFARLSEPDKRNVGFVHLDLGWMTKRSAIVGSMLPALFIVPIITVSPSSMFRRVTKPLMGR
jgi:hypothetical protein